MLDQLSGGRMELGLGLGYAPHEFRAFGIPVSRRVSLTEECIDILPPGVVGRALQLRTASGTTSTTCW